ncbi:pyroglutamyl peptidase [Streptomyces griseoviridis]|uniref:Pyroglutamyl peptidase n=1 Tax=Streptomyces griseoviridis TaxID=45398 RepID=A0A918G676_STRGD|nr:pyroglutamyl peptidase [Streptomyces niveoruber]GGS20142.1 hypothetical protein GCM10010238_05480 [Streptomyces niveoruber]
MTGIGVRISGLALAAVSGLSVTGLSVTGVAQAAPGVAPGATAPSAPASAATVEEQRLDGAVPQEILRRSGFDAVAPAFARALERAGSYEEARRVAVRQGSALWRRAVDRAQGRGPVAGDLPVDDDRPLYWARLGMTREVRGLQPGFSLTERQRDRLLEALERTTRGQSDIRLPGAEGGLKRVLVTGFDPFTLDRDIRISNPSGASALALDGTVIETAAGPARVETAVFPVRWDDFAAGEVERTLRPHLPKADLFMTVSQGRVGRFDVERTNGAWRGGFADNANVSRTGLAPVSDPATQPQWTTTTLPYREIVAADTGRFPVYDNTSVTEIPAGGTGPVVRPDGPTPGSAARAGGGGDYLSNEIAYRATLLRDRLGLRDRVPGGHVHTPVLQFAPDDTTEVTDPEFETNRRDIVGQVRGIVGVAVGAVR